MPTGQWTLKGNTAYYWCNRWPGEELVIGGLRAKVLQASLLSDGEPVSFEQTDTRLILRGLPEANPDGIAGVAVVKIECDEPPRQVLGAGYVVL
jgi:alpha-L-fucosidase